MISSVSNKVDPIIAIKIKKIIEDNNYLLFANPKAVSVFPISSDETEYSIDDWINTMDELHISYSVTETIEKRFKPKSINIKRKVIINLI